jgi:hypothetical protein
VFGSATADTSASARRAHPVDTVCQVGFVSKAEQPEPAPLHARSVHPRVVVAARLSEVPPTAVTYREVAGYAAPVPLSPVLAVIATPGWLKWTSADV